jgi:class 3 adenylate cyclase/pimeloyl-ACP methyl ester carboxylesterase
MKAVTRYAKSGNVHIAYQVFGNGAVDLVIVPPFVSNVENFWDEPSVARWLLHIAGYARVLMFDKRGTGMSDAVSELPGVDQRIDDIMAVIDAAGMPQPALLGISEGGSLAAVFAATHPQRCRSLLLYGSFARFSSWLPTTEALAGFLGYIDEAWGTGGSLPLFAPSRRDDAAFQDWWGRFERRGASPSAASALMRMNSQIDIAGILNTIHVPTLVIHRTDDVTIHVEGGRYLASHIAGARLVELPGSDHVPMVGDNAIEIADLIGEFLTGTRVEVDVDRVLATVLFTDIVGSTEKASALGDRRWHDLLESHHAIVRRDIARFRGRENDTAGDGFLITFDGPARAVRCACAIADEVQSLGIQIRAGLHSGECEVMGDKVGGVAVHIGARVAALAGAGEILVSSTVKDLVAGSGLSFSDKGSHALKGVPGKWRVLAVEH